MPGMQVNSISTAVLDGALVLISCGNDLSIKVFHRCMLLPELFSPSYYFRYGMSPPELSCVASLGTSKLCGPLLERRGGASFLQAATNVWGCGLWGDPLHLFNFVQDTQMLSALAPFSTAVIL